jgi:CheY-like chemotaxis protein
VAKKMSIQRVIKILLVEDDLLDQLEVKRTLDKKGIFNRLKIAINGEQALDILEGNDNDVFVGRPDLILVDINMPKMNGFEFLAKLRANESWKDFKVFMLTTSDEKEDKKMAMSLNVSGFITKPLKLESPSSIDAFNLMIDLMNMQAQ